MGKGQTFQKRCWKNDNDMQKNEVGYSSGDGYNIVNVLNAMELHTYK